MNSLGGCQNSSKPFRPDLDWSKRCLNPVYLRIFLKFRQGGGTWLLNFRPSKFRQFTLFDRSHQEPPFKRSVGHTLLPPLLRRRRHRRPSPSRLPLPSRLPSLLPPSTSRHGRAFRRRRVAIAPSIAVAVAPPARAFSALVAS